MPTLFTNFDPALAALESAAKKAVEEEKKGDGGQDHKEGDHKEDSHKEGDHKEGDHDHGGEGHAHEGGHHGHPEGYYKYDPDAEADLDASMGMYLSPDHLLAHVQDAPYFELPNVFGSSLEKIDKDSHEHQNLRYREPYHLNIPNPLGITEKNAIMEAQSDFLGPITFQPTKFVVLELFGALIVSALFITLGQKMRDGQQVKGRFWNLLEFFIVFVRDEIAKPAIGSQDAKRFLPFLWSIFFFILTLNLIGMVPFLGAATGSISVTSVLAFSVFVVVIATGTKKMGVVGFWKAQVPHMDLPGPLALILVPMIWLIEVFGLFVKHLVLAVRLFANMFAGHMVLAVFVAFIGVTWNTSLSYGVVPAVIAASTGVNLLELLVAFIQAYVFTFLAALFIGAAVHPH